MDSVVVAAFSKLNDSVGLQKDKNGGKKREEPALFR